MIKSFSKFKIAIFACLLVIFASNLFNFIKDDKIWRAENVRAATSCKGPADVILVIDRSATMADSLKFSAAKSASVNFIDKLFATEPDSSYGSCAYHQIGLVAFNNNIDSESLNQSGSLIQNIINQSDGILGSSYPSDYRRTSTAIEIAKNKLDPDLSSVNSCATKTMIVLTDGAPYYDIASARAHADSAKSKDIRIVSVGLKLDEIVDSGKRTEAEDFIKYPEGIASTSSDCYYISESGNTLDGCTTISATDLETALDGVYNNITAAVCDESPPSVEIYRTPQNTLYSVDKLVIKSVATDDIGFESHTLRWSDNWANPGDIIEIACGNLSGTVIECSTEELGPFSVGDIISYRSTAKDANGNEASIDLPDPRSVTVANVSLNVPALFRNVNNEISVTISDPNGKADLDSFYITVDAPILAGVEIEKAAMSCSGSGSSWICTYNFNTANVGDGCLDWTDGITDGKANNINVNMYVYADSQNDDKTDIRQIASSENQPLVSYFEGNDWGNCSDGINNDCDYDASDNPIIDVEEMSCDAGNPLVGISRVPSGDVYDDDSATFTSGATDSNGIKQHTIYYREDGGVWQAAFDCNDTNVDSLCDEDTSQNIANISATVGPFVAGTVIDYFSEAIDYSGNDNEGSTATESFIVRNRECEGVGDLGACLVTPGGKCCGGVCNAAISNPNSYNTSCSKEICGDAFMYEEDVWISGKYGNALSFDGENDYVEVSDSASLNITGNTVSCAAWVYIGNQSNDVGIIAKGPSVNQERYMLGIQGDEKPRMRVYTGSYTQAVADNPLSQNEWHYLVGTYDGSNIRIYVDGNLAKSVSKSGNLLSSSNPVVIGRRVLSDNRYYNGLIDEARVYNRVLSPEEIFSQYNGTFSNNTGLVGHWDFDENSGTTAYDSSGNGNNGTLVNFPGPTIKSGILWQWDFDNEVNGVICSDDGNSDGCYAFSDIYGSPPGVPPYFFDGGCEERAYTCSAGYCTYGAMNINKDHCVGEESLILNDYECVGNSCQLDPNPAVKNDICDLELDSLSVNAYNSNSVFICGSSGAATGEVLDNLTNNVSLRSITYDENDISEQKIYWKEITEADYNIKNCNVNSCGDVLDPCDCSQDIGSFDVGDIIEFYSSSKDDSPNQTERITDIYSFTVHDSECYDIPGGDKPNLTSCDSENGMCCGGSCDSSVSSTSFDEGCYVNSCNGTNWVYAVSNEFGDTKEGDLCGSTDSCFNYYSPNNNFYSGCITGGNKCSSGYCAVSSSLTSIPACNGNLLTNYNCDPDNATGTCQPKDSNIDCSVIGNYDTDSVDCNCDCDGYDIEEKVYSSLSFDGIDDFVDLPGDIITRTALQNNGATHAVWVKADSSLMGSKGIVGLSNCASGWTILGLDYSNGKARLQIYDSAGGYVNISSSSGINDGGWHYLVGTFDPSDNRTRIYVDGNLEATSQVIGDPGWGTNDHTNYIGKLASGNNYFNGLIDDVRIYNRALYPEEVMDHYNGIFADDTGLVGHWDFDEGTGETAEDSSGNGNDGSLSNVDGILGNDSYGPGWDVGVYGSGLDFDGSNDYVKVSNSKGFKYADATVMLWFKLDEYKDINLFTKDEDGCSGDCGHTQIRYQQGDDEIDIRFQPDIETNSLTAPGSSKIELNRWHHIALVFGSDGAYLYLDGVEEDSVATTDYGWVNNDADIWLGTQYGAGSKFLNGGIDEVKIYSRALSAGEVADYYDGITNNTNLVGYWNFNEGSGTIAYDSSENGPVWMKYYHDSSENNVPENWQVCTDGKDNDCDTFVDNYDDVNGISNCDGKVDDVFVTARAKNSEGVENSNLFSSSLGITIYDVDIERVNNDFTLSSSGTSDEFSIRQTIIEWTTDNWASKSERVCNNTGFCEVCVEGGTCGEDNDLILSSSLSAGNTFNFRVCAWDNSINNNKKCTDYHGTIILSSNLVPEITPLSVQEPNFCAGLSYVLNWEFSDPDDGQDHYEIQIKEGDNNFDSGSLIVDTLKNSGEDNYIIDSSDFIDGNKIEYGKTYYWRVRATDDRSGGYEQTTEWENGPLFTTPEHKYPQVDFSATPDHSNECLYEVGYSGAEDRCDFGEDITFSDDSDFVECTDSNNKECLTTNAAKCDIANSICAPCEGNDECVKFKSLPNVNYSCNTGSGICEASGSCATDDDCKAADAAKCDIDSGLCVFCDDDLQCTNDKFGTIGIDYFCDSSGKCEDKEHRKWYFYDDLHIDSADSNPVNNYIDSEFNSYIVTLKIKDILGNVCLRRKEILLGGRDYPRWNEMSPSGN